MKKSLLAVAAIGAFASAAQAQSSVTVYGIIDAGFVSSSSTAAGPGAAINNSATAATAAGSQGNIVSKTQTSGFAGGGESTGRLGFKGNEDLGGGNTAFFTVEMALSPDSSTSISSTNATSNRQSFVGLGKKGLGQASIGMQYTPIHEAVSATDAGGTNNVNGNVIYDRTGGYGSQQIVAGGGVSGQAGSGMSTNTSYTVRSSNALVVKSENFAGFNLKGLLVASGKDSSQATVTTSTKAYGVGADYNWNKLLVTANYQTFLSEGVPSGYDVPATFSAGYNGGVSTPGTNARDTQQYYAATYDFGILKAYAQYVARKVVYTNNNNIFTERTAQQIGVRSSLTPTITAWASAGTGSMNNTGANGPKAAFNGWQLGSDYALSKRTNLYAIYGQTATRNAATGLYSASAAAAASNALYSAQTSYNASSYAIGVRHTF
ncbi:porin [Polynucleobacter sp. Adler-ghost]|uniref:porin n=1 Tax=Polynucleobacter sp. Adler-ghost TaxID=2770234 RepID=UPI001BFD7F46|nr:porin [Polynucleobacter sp. Adler-ghost]QWE30863.1 porin [Polynucleobacter sp. Adler-ghost]